MEKLAFLKTGRQNCSYLNRECRTSFGVILFSFMEGEWGSTFHGEWTISSHKVGESGSHFGKDHLFFFLCNHFPERAAVGNAFLFSWRRGD